MEKMGGKRTSELCNNFKGNNVQVIGVREMVQRDRNKKFEELIDNIFPNLMKNYKTTYPRHNKPQAQETENYTKTHDNQIAQIQGGRDKSLKKKKKSDQRKDTLQTEEQR